MFVIESNGIGRTADMTDDIPQIIIKFIGYFRRRRSSMKIFKLSFNGRLFLSPSQKIERSSWVGHEVTEDWTDIEQSINRLDLYGKYLSIHLQPHTSPVMIDT